MPRYPIVPKSRQTLLDLATPDTASQPEAVPQTFYDTQAYTSTTTVTQTFFQATNADRTLSNMDAAGQFPDPQFFEIYYIQFDFLFPAISTNAGVGGNLDDMTRLLNGGRGIFTLQLSNKNYGPWRIRSAHGAGPFMPGGMVNQNATAATTQQIGVNGFPDGGMWIGGQIVIPPKLNFSIVTTFAAAQTIATTPLNIRCSLVGTLHRRVL